MVDKTIRKRLALAIIFLFLGASITPTTGLLNESFALSDGRAILYVGGSGPGNYSSIQDAIDNASDGDMVFVYNGTYYEHIILNKMINLTGEDRNTTIIDGSENGDTVRIIANKVTISEFTIQNSGEGKENWDAGIEVYGLDNHTILNNNIYGPSNAGTRALNIWLRSSNNNIITGNNLSNNNYGLVLWDSNTNKIFKNEIFNSYYYGISISQSSNNNQIYHNNFINYTHSSWDECNNSWDTGYPLGGNYLDNYSGIDLYSGPNQDIPGSDGIGDTPYNITGGNNQDLYPLMYPFEQYYILNISAPEEVIEGELFNAVVTTIGGTIVPNASVDFNDELKLTDSDGRVYFTTPQVGEDVYYDIIANKSGYTGDTEMILIKDIPYEFEPMFIVGKIDNVATEDNIITFEAERIMIVDFYPFGFLFNNEDELITIQKGYYGIVDARFVFALCYTSIER